MSTESNIRTRVTLRYLDETAQTLPLRDLTLDRIDDWAPARAFRWHQGQRHFPGFYWCATTGTHVGYESLLERDRLILADFDRGVVNIKSQPFLLEMRDEVGRIRHIPDYLLVRTNAPPCIVNVKTPDAAATDKAQRLFACVAVCAAARRWHSEVWTGAPAIRMENVRFLAGFRRAWLIDADALGAVLTAARPGMTLTEIERASGFPHDLARPASMHAVWSSRLVLDLDESLQPTSEVIACPD